MAQGIAVGTGFDCRVALDQVAEQRVVAVIKQQMMGADLGSDAFVCQRTAAKQAQFTSAGQVQHMKAGAEALGQGHRQAGGLIASLGIANQWVHRWGDLSAMARVELGFARTDARRVLTVRQQHGRAVGEQALQGWHVIDQHVAGGCAHEHLHPGDALWVKGDDGVQVGGTDAKVKAVVNP
ncbi:hypothetical protein D9M71_448160 [compost metagenome]